MAPPATCVVSADFVMSDGTPAYRISLELLLRDGIHVAAGNWVGGKKTFYSDADGHMEFSVVQGVTYTVRIGQRTDLSFQWEAPTDAACDLFDHLVPYITNIDFETDPIAVGVGERLSVRVIATFSDGDTEELNSNAVEIVAANPAIATTEGLEVIGVSVGSTTLSIDSVSDDDLPQYQDMIEEMFIVLPRPTYVVGADATVNVV